MVLRPEPVVRGSRLPTRRPPAPRCRVRGAGAASPAGQRSGRVRMRRPGHGRTAVRRTWVLTTSTGVSTAMNALFHLTMVVLLVATVWSAVALVRRTRQRREAWESGLTAPARVVRAWATTQMVNNVARRVQWHEYDYTTRDGRAIRFKESGGPRDRAEGDTVPVHYSPQEPDKATAVAPQSGKDAAALVFWLLLLGGCAVFLLYEWVSLSTALS
ncbi:DUF3592 domain-containing protein [Streptomyces sp. JHA26]|uniref:DUF3592 domain-containing protein n=1 Tax=Streptomyces sp. JHA26 TaxID=1917143 RepID=UPI0035CF2EE2